MRKPISIQLYSVREACASDFPGVLRQIADIGYMGVEFAGLHGMSPAEVGKITRDLGLRVSSSHVGIPTRDTIGQMVEQELALGNTMLISGLGPDDFKDKERCERSIERLHLACEHAKEAGVRFGMHNHWWEFGKLDGVLIYDHIMQSIPELLGELDVYWAAFGGSEPVDVIKRHSNRLRLLHIKDGPLEQGKPHTAVGQGKLNMPAIIESADPAVLDWIIVELDSCATDMMTAVRESYNYLAGKGLAIGND